MVKESGTNRILSMVPLLLQSKDDNNKGEVMTEGHLKIKEYTKQSIEKLIQN